MKLAVAHRTPGKKSEIKSIRREGGIPAVIYSKGEKGKEIAISGLEFKKGLNSVEPGTLSSQIFTLTLNGKEIRAVVKDIQYHVTTYDILHLDFEELHDGHALTLNIPIKCMNVNDCAGVKLGGVLRQIIRHMRIKVLPKDIPSHFEIDVRDMNMGQSKKLGSIQFPKNVHPVTDLKEVAVVIGKR